MSDAPVTTRARDLTPQEAQERAEHCFELHQQVVAGLSAGRAALWSTAAALHEFNEQRGWSALGGYDKLSDWLADPEVGMTSATFHRLIGVYEQLAVRRQIPMSTLTGVDLSKAALTLPALRTGKVSAEEALSDAREMGWRDLRDHYVKRPDGGSTEPAVDNDGDDDGLSASTPVNDGTDNAPTWAGDVEPAQNPETTGSGQDDDVEIVDAVVVPDSAEHVELGGALAEAQEALALAQRLPGSRQAVRKALRRLSRAAAEVLSHV